MENILILEQTTPLLAIVLIFLALFLGSIFYLWSVQNLKRIESQVIKMKNNVSSLEHLSQSIYEAAYFNMKKANHRNNSHSTFVPNIGMALDELKEVKKQIKYITERQAEIDQILCKKMDDDQAEIYSSKNKTSIPHFVQEEEDKFHKISELIIMHLRNLNQDKGQATAQELVYAMPNKYSLADIYRTLEIMKEQGKISWEDRNIHPGSFLILL